MLYRLVERRGTSREPRYKSLIMLTRTLVAVVATACLLAVPTAGAGAQRGCSGADTQSDMKRCAVMEARGASRRLDSLLAELNRVLDSTRARELRLIQREWVRVRDAHCRWDAASYEGGSVQPMWYADCITVATYRRIEDLRPHLCDDDAGMATACPPSRRYARPAPGRRRQ